MAKMAMAVLVLSSVAWPVDANPPLEWLGADPDTLTVCQGDCDNDSDCPAGSVCVDRENGAPAAVEGCDIGDSGDSARSATDYCSNPATETMRLADMENGAEFTKCVKIDDYEKKTPDEEMTVMERDGSSSCCPHGFTPGVKHYDQYLSAMIVCGFKEDGTVSVSTGSTCTYNKCFVIKADMTCKDNTKMKVNGCCPSGQAPDDCTIGSSSSNSLNYCTRFKAQDWKLENTAGKADDVTDGKLQVDKLEVYTECPGVSAGGGDADSDADSAPKRAAAGVAGLAALAATMFA